MRIIVRMSRKDKYWTTAWSWPTNKLTNGPNDRYIEWKSRMRFWQIRGKVDDIVLGFAIAPVWLLPKVCQRYLHKHYFCSTRLHRIIKLFQMQNFCPGAVNKIFPPFAGFLHMLPSIGSSIFKTNKARYTGQDDAPALLILRLIPSSIRPVASHIGNRKWVW